MSKSRDTKPESSDTAEPQPVQSPGSASHVSPSPGKVETIKVKKGTWRRYDATDGLPGGVWCLLQDRRGFLWLGTEVGLCRYDGTEFITYTTSHGLTHNYVYAICEDREGRLWFGTRGGGVSCFDGQNFVNYTTAHGLADDHVSAVCEDSQGRLWFGTDGGVSCFDRQRFANYTTSDGLGHNRVQAICEDRRGRLWFGTGCWDRPGRGVSCFDGDRFITYTTKNGLPYDSVMAICEDRQGYLWFATCGGGVSCFNGQEFTSYTTEDGLAASYVLAICEDQQGRLWFGTFGAGVSCFHGRNFTTYTTEDGLLDNRVLGIIQDREGNLWFANMLGGLTRFDTETMQLLTEEPVSEILTQDRQGGLWFGHEHELCYLREGRLRRWAFALTATIYSILEDSSGSIWVGLLEDGLYYYDSIDAVWNSDGKHFTFGNELPGRGVSSLIEARDGTIWVGTEGTPGYLCRAVCSESLTKPGLKQGDVNAFEAIPTPYGMPHRLFEDSRGRIYIGGWVWAGGGMGGGGLSHYDENKPGHLNNYKAEGGILDDSVMSIVEDDSGNLWIGTSQGLYCYDGMKFTLYGEEQGLSCLTHQWSTKDANGQLWFGTLGGGVYRYDGKHFQTLTTRDGLPSNSVTGFVPQTDGSMIIGTYRGIAHYHPTATLPPSVEIRKVIADQVYLNPTELELIITDTRLLTISFHGLNLATRQMRYSYILEGHDAKWQDTWDRQVLYENLPIGEYTFKVIAINRDLITSEVPAILKLKVIPDPRDVMVTELQSDLEVKNQQLIFLKREMEQKHEFEEIIGESEAIRFVRAQMSQVIDKDVNVLITGETGTGKELVARGIHHNSSRKDKILLPCNCGSIPRELVKSILFGHRKGAFTGANEDKIGLFEIASGGTVLLDEIGDMPVDIQPSLLRVLQERKFQRLGEEHEFRDLDVRIISITNRDILQEIKAGRFRRDLYYRLNGFHIFVPPLRDRRDDIPLLAEHFYQEACKKQRKELSGFASEALDMLTRHTWPGNVRELQTEIERACILAQSGIPIQTYHLSPETTQGESLAQEIMSERVSYRESLNRFGQRLVEGALQECNGNRTQAARLLGMDRSNLIKLIKRLGIDA